MRKFPRSPRPAAKVSEAATIPIDPKRRRLLLTLGVGGAGAAAASLGALPAAAAGEAPRSSPIRMPVIARRARPRLLPYRQALRRGKDHAADTQNGTSLQPVRVCAESPERQNADDGSADVPEAFGSRGRGRGVRESAAVRRHRPGRGAAEGATKTEVKRTVCTHCSVGCAVDATVENGVWTRQKPVFDSPLNLGAHCAKGASVREHGCTSTIASRRR